MKIERQSREGHRNGQRQLRTWLVVLFLASAVLGAWFLIRPALGPAAYFRPGPAQRTYSFNRQVLLLFIPYALALVAWWRGARVPLWTLLAGAGFLHLLVLFAPLPQSQDFYQYIFYGRMQSAHGVNPYVVPPSVFNWDPWYGWIRWRNQPSLYGPVWMLTSFAVTKAVSGSLALAFASLKLVVLALDIAVVALILRLARDRPDPAGAAGWGVLAYAWNPLILITVPLGGVVDVGIAAAFLGAVFARRRMRPGLATVLLALAALLKVYAAVALLLHLVLVARERGRGTAARHAAASLGLAALAYAPYWAGFRTFEGLLSLATLTNRSLAGTVQRLLAPVLLWVGVDAAADVAGAIVRWIGIAVLGATIAWAARKVWSEGELWQPVIAVLLVYLLVTPWLVYWYVVAPLALVAALPASRFTFPILTFSATALVETRFPPWLLAQVVEVVLKYAPSLIVYSRVRSPTLPGEAHGLTASSRERAPLPAKARMGK